MGKYHAIYDQLLSAAQITNKGCKVSSQSGND